ncbi:FAD/NAD(P)-dependent oxidoreductase [Sphingomonas hengshuiensis]|uniref:FAD/NAD(P)-dependent oxidoreductase n=1 Tax=Sphingomonas hengshuiensis TaxID=1609977 RepID=UPI00069868F9|nr:NAD(P)/FAD-dependent oxidoreductase [Sphingomonas hengshuiensis]
MAEALSFDVAIVGGGPAGQAAAIQLAGHGLSIAVVDEQARPGGQILRQPPRAFRVAHWLAGRSYRALHAQFAAFEALPVTWLGGHSVLDAAPGRLLLHGPDGAVSVTARRILIAAGCQDLAVPIPGWTLPGVYSAGGVQAMVKSQQIVPGARVLLAGTHPLQLVIAEQIVRGGGTVAGVLFAQSRAAMLAPMLRDPAAAFRRATDLLAGQAALATLRRAGVPVRYGVGLTALRGSDWVSEAITTDGTIACDAVGLCYGFVPQSGLPRMLGAEVVQAGPAGGWRCVHDEWMRTSVAGVFAAGETTGVAGAAAAAAGGALAGIGIARDLGSLAPDAAERAAAAPRRVLARHRRFAALLDAIADPRGHFPALEPETLVCRCEDVPHAALCAEVATGASANAIKRATRCGMGLCQGRNCEPSLLRMIAAPDPGFTARFPARPVTIGDLAGD